jgi:hypothetical protein
VAFGYPAPGGGIRQERISSSDQAGAHSRFISNQFSSFGRQYIYSHYMVHPSGLWAIGGGTNFVDGRSIVGFAVSLPSWPQGGTAGSDIVANDFLSTPITFAAGPAYAMVRFGYSRWIGPDGDPSSFKCTARAEACNSSAPDGQLYLFENESKTLKACASGCTVTIPLIAPNITYYQRFRSDDGISWTAEGDVIACAVGDKQ